LLAGFFGLHVFVLAGRRRREGAEPLSKARFLCAFFASIVCSLSTDTKLVMVVSVYGELTTFQMPC
jgi:hypothetical protein